MAVGEAQVWAGSFDTSIYVIDVRSKTCQQVLFEHEDMVCGMTVVQSHRYDVTPSHLRLPFVICMLGFYLLATSKGMYFI